VRGRGAGALQQVQGVWLHQPGAVAGAAAGDAAAGDAVGAGAAAGDAAVANAVAQVECSRRSVGTRPRSGLDLTLNFVSGGGRDGKCSAALKAPA